LEAKLPLPRALAFCEPQANNYELKNSIAEMRSDLENGQTLAVALEAQGNTIPDRLQSLLRLGERSNTLPEAVSRTAEMLRTELECPSSGFLEPMAA
jgi:general secretion pathway protein F